MNTVLCPGSVTDIATKHYGDLTAATKNSTITEIGLNTITDTITSTTNVTYIATETMITGC